MRCEPGQAKTVDYKIPISIYLVTNIADDSSGNKLILGYPQ